MQSTPHALQALETAVGVMAWATRQLVTLANGVYLAGHASGVIWHRWGRLTLLATTRAITRVWPLIDWPTALAITKDALVVIVAGMVAAAQVALPLLVELSASMGRRYALLLGVQAPMAAVAGIAAVVPTRVAAPPAGKTKGTRAGKTKGVIAETYVTATRPTRAPHRRQQLALALELVS
jgi:hypothetical protein